MRRVRIHAARRAGLSLLEVLLSAAILAAALAALGQLVAGGLRGSIVARRQTEAAARAASILGEFVCGAREISPTSSSSASTTSPGRPFDDDPAWTWSVATRATDTPGLTQATVTVTRVGGGAAPDVSFTLTRLVRAQPAASVEEGRTR